MSKSIIKPTPAGIAMSVIGSPIVSTIGDVITTCSKEKTKRIEMSPAHLNSKARAECSVIRTQGETEAMVVVTKHRSKAEMKERMLESEVNADFEKSIIRDRDAQRELYIELIKTCDASERHEYVRAFDKLVSDREAKHFAERERIAKAIADLKEAKKAEAKIAEAQKEIKVAEAKEETARLELKASKIRKDSMGFFDHVFVNMIKPYADVIEEQASAAFGRPVVIDQYGKPKLKSVK